MLLLSHAPGGALSARRCPTATQFSQPKPPLFSKAKRSSLSSSVNPRTRPNLTLFASAADGDSAPATFRSVSASPLPSDETVFVGDDGVPLEGVIQFEKAGSSSTSQIRKWGRVAVLASGDIACLLTFSAIGRFAHGFPVLDFDTVRTADPFMAGWFLSAYFLGGYAEDGRGENGFTKAITAAAKSWALGIPLGIAIRSATSGHVPNSSFILVSMGSTLLLLIGWRALLNSLFSSGQNKGNDIYKRGSPFELFELLTSLIRRW